MGKRGLVEIIILHLINLVFTVIGIGTMGFGLFCFLMWKQNPSKQNLDEINTKYFIVHRMLLALHAHPPTQSSHPLPMAWFIYLTVGVGAILFIISCCGYIGATSRSPCCLLSYCVFLVALVTVELGTGAFIFFQHNWEEVLPEDRSGSFDRMYNFVNGNWKVIRWVALGVIILQVIGMVVAVYLRSEFKHAIWYGKSEDVERFPRVRTSKYRVLGHSNSNPSTTTSVSSRAPTRPTK